MALHILLRPISLGSLCLVTGLIMKSHLLKEKYFRALYLETLKRLNMLKSCKQYCSIWTKYFYQVLTHCRATQIHLLWKPIEGKWKMRKKGLDIELEMLYRKGTVNYLNVCTRWNVSFKDEKVWQMPNLHFHLYERKENKDELWVVNAARQDHTSQFHNVTLPRWA